MNLLDMITIVCNFNPDNTKVVLSSTIKGNNNIISQNGNVEIDSALPMEEHTINIDGYYDLEVNGSDFDYDDHIRNGDYEYIGQKSSNLLTINGGGIDIELRFAY